MEEALRKLGAFIILKIKEEIEMTKLEKLNKEYEGLRGKALSNIILYITMPTGETEVIVNPDVKQKIEYINKTYNEDLVHANCKEIYITEYIIVEEYSVILNFGDALAALKDGFKVRRRGWNGKGIFIELQTPTELSKMTNPYIFIDTTGLQTENELAPKSLVPWVASQTDMLAEDWEVVE